MGSQKTVQRNERRVTDLLPTAQGHRTSSCAIRVSSPQVLNLSQSLRVEFDLCISPGPKPNPRANDVNKEDE
jgi:hypothetical protein